jgi:hypothetical protein
MHPLVQKFYDEHRWKDRCLLLEIIHIKMKQQSASKKKKWNVKDTAKMLKLSVGAVSEDLRIAQAISNESLDSSIKSRNQAVKLLRSK